MSPQKSPHEPKPTLALSRRGFLAGTAVTAGALAAVHESPASLAEPDAAARKIKLGVVGCGGRGAWIANRTATATTCTGSPTSLPTV